MHIRWLPFCPPAGALFVRRSKTSLHSLTHPSRFARIRPLTVLVSVTRSSLGRKSSSSVSGHTPTARTPAAKTFSLLAVSGLGCHGVLSDVIQTPHGPTVNAMLGTTGAHVYYEVRGDGPGVLLVGCPMDATAFAPLADLLAVDHTVITTDPRGINRSTVDDPDQDVTPEMLADDLSQLLHHLSLGPVAVFGSSGGAVSALALVQAHPDQVHTVVAHEPPLDELLDDRAELRAVTEDIVATYLSGDVGGAWGKFLTSANITLSDDDMAQWASEPTLQAAADELFFFAHTLRPATYWLPDLPTLRAGGTRIIVGIGEASTGQACERTSKALATSLGISPMSFPGDHVGFTTHPRPFAGRLAPLLSDSNSQPEAGIRPPKAQPESDRP